MSKRDRCAVTLKRSKGKRKYVCRVKTARKAKENHKIISSCAQIHANAISLTHKGGA